MSINERIKYLREEVLKMGRQKFGEGIGVGRGAITGLESTTKIKAEDRTFNAICKKYNINPDWLRTGKGEIFKEKSFIAELAEKYDLGFREKTLIESILNLPPTARDAVIDWALDFATKIEEENIRQENELVEKRRNLQQQKKDIEAQLKKIDEEEQAAFDNAKKDSPLEDTG